MKSIYDDTFEHHGIKGQKWGVQNGPPYPLDENSGSNSSGKHGGDKKKSGSSGEHRLSSLFRKRDKIYRRAAEEDVNILRSEFKYVFRLLGNTKYNDIDIERVMARYMTRSDQNPRLAHALWLYDIYKYNVTGKYVEHDPKQVSELYTKKPSYLAYCKK